MLKTWCINLFPLCNLVKKLGTFIVYSLSFNLADLIGRRSNLPLLDICRCSATLRFFCSSQKFPQIEGKWSKSTDIYEQKHRYLQAKVIIVKNFRDLEFQIQKLLKFSKNPKLDFALRRNEKIIMSAKK